MHSNFEQNLKEIIDITFVFQRHFVFCQVHAEAEETVEY
jgi:hypothetical protein